MKETGKEWKEQEVIIGNKVNEKGKTPTGGTTILTGLKKPFIKLLDYIYLRVYLWHV